MMTGEPSGRPSGSLKRNAEAPREPWIVRGQGGNGSRSPLVADSEWRPRQ